jgi:Domain of unknown function (DUF4350)
MWVVAGGLAVLLVVGVLLLGPGSGGGPPLWPRSNDRLGTSALVRLERELGADVRIGDRLPDLTGADAPDVMLLLTDLLTDEQRDAVDEWVAGGGVLVVTDPISEFVPPDAFQDFERVSDLGPAATLRGRCEIGALDQIDVSKVGPLHGGALYQAPSGADTCLANGDGLAYIAVRSRGSGTIVAVGGAGMMVNAALAEGNNAPVASALLATGQGTDIVVLEPGPLGSAGGDRTLLQLISPGVKRFLLQLAIAFVAFALWRGRRLGRPVPEPQPVKVAASELVAAVGGLLDRSRSPGHAAELMRADMRRFLGDRMGLAPGSGDDALVSVTAARTGVAEDRLRLALTDPVTDDAGLVRLASTLDSIRQEVLAHV